MRLKNVWLGLREDAVADIGVEGNEVATAAMLSHPDFEHILQSTKVVTDADGFKWYAYSLYLDAALNLTPWLMLYAGKVIIGGCWEMDGRQFGTSLDAEGNLIGEPQFPLDMRMLGFMPDDVTYDENGVELSRTAAVELKQINLIAGQIPRKFN